MRQRRKRQEMTVPNNIYFALNIVSNTHTNIYDNTMYFFTTTKHIFAYWSFHQEVLFAGFSNFPKFS